MYVKTFNGCMLLVFSLVVYETLNHINVLEFHSLVYFSYLLNENHIVVLSIENYFEP